MMKEKERWEKMDNHLLPLDGVEKLSKQTIKVFGDPYKVIIIIERIEKALFDGLIWLQSGSIWKIRLKVAEKNDQQYTR